MRRADGFEDGWPEDWREDVVPVDPDRDPRFPRCWDLATGAEVTESVWYLNRDRDPPRAVLVGNGGERGIRLAAVRVSSARGGMGRELSAAAAAECAAALRASASRAAAARRLGCDRGTITHRAARYKEIREALPGDGRIGRERTAADAAASRRRRKYSDAELVRALESVGGNMARAAEALSCPAASVKDRVRRDPALRAARDRFQVEAEAARRAEIAAALRESGGNLARAAEFLAVSVRQLRRWVRADAALRAVWAELRAA